MNTIILKNTTITNNTIIPNQFIDHYMVKANGEFIKVYLYLLRHLNQTDQLLITQIADSLNHTENDILRAFRYWEQEGLLRTEKDAGGNLLSLEMLPFPVDSVTTPVRSESPAVTVPAKKTVQSLAKSSSADNKKARKELKSLFFIAEQYLGRTLSKTDLEIITYFYKDLEMSAGLIEYLIESCVENGHNSIHYIQKVALSWADEGIVTIEQAKNRSTAYNKNCYTVLNAFGIKNRAPASSELVYIRKWTEQLCFTLDIIEEACNRTISATHQPTFEYADSILENWHKNGVHHLKDIVALDAAFQKEKEKKSKTVSSDKTKASPKSFNNFERRSYDMDSLEAQLLKSNSN